MTQKKDAGLKQKHNLLLEKLLIVVALLWIKDIYR